MNVENRKLFTNRDARAKLATMGGIMGSSPELLGEVQKFAEAGEVKAPMFLVQGIEGYSGNQFLHLTAPELDLLKRITDIASVPLDVQEATPEILSQINPMQLSSTDNPNVKRLFADIGIELPQEQAPVETPVNTVRQEIPQSSFLPMNTAADSTDPFGVLTNPRTGEPMTLLPPQERSTQALEPMSEFRTLLNRFATRGKAPDRDLRVATETPGFMDSDTGSVMGFSPEISLEMSDKLKRLAKLRGAQTGQNVLVRAADVAGGALGTAGAGILAARDDLRGYAAGVAGFPTLADKMFQQSQESRNTALSYFGEDNTPSISNRFSESTAAEELAAQRAQIQAESLAAIENADPSVFSEGAPTEITPAGRAQRAADSVTRMSEQGMPKGLSAEAINRIQEQQARVAAGSVTRMSEQGPNFVPSEKTITEEKTTEGQIENSAGQLVDAEGNYVPIKENLEVMPGDLNAQSDAQSLGNLKTTAERIGLGNLTSEDIVEINAKILAEKDNTIIGEEIKPGDVEEAMSTIDTEKSTKLDGGPSTLLNIPQVANDLIDNKKTGSEALVSSYTGTNQKLTTKEAVLAQQAIFKEMLGMDDEDKAKEKWHNMAMVGFAIAAGQDPNALSNIASGLLEGTKLARQDRKAKQKREDDVTLLSIQAVQDQKKRDDAYTQAMNVASVRAGGSSDKISDAFRLQLNASRKGLIDSQPTVGTKADPNQIETAANLQAFQNILRQFGNDVVKTSPLYQSNKTMIDNAILANQTQDAQSFIGG